MWLSGDDKTCIIEVSSVAPPQYGEYETLKNVEIVYFSAFLQGEMV